MTIELKAIGIVQSTLVTLDQCPRQEDEGAPQATIVIYDEFLKATSNIKDGDVLILLTWLDRADRNALNTHPRNDPAAALTGVFSTRSPDRPNPIGLHEVTVISFENKNTLIVSSLEVLDGTPVIDIKSSR